MIAFGRWHFFKLVWILQNVQSWVFVDFNLKTGFFWLQWPSCNLKSSSIKKNRKCPALPCLATKKRSTLTYSMTIDELLPATTIWKPDNESTECGVCLLDYWQLSYLFPLSLSLSLSLSLTPGVTISILILIPGRRISKLLNWKKSWAKV